MKIVSVLGSHDVGKSSVEGVTDEVAAEGKDVHEDFMRDSTSSRNCQTIGASFDK